MGCVGNLIGQIWDTAPKRYYFLERFGAVPGFFTGGGTVDQLCVRDHGSILTQLILLYGVLQLSLHSQGWRDLPSLLF